MTLEEIVLTRVIDEGPKDYPSVTWTSAEDYARDRLNAMSQADFLGYISDALAKLNP